MGIFGGKKDMAGAKPFGRGRYAPPCKATLELRSFGTKLSQDPDTKDDVLLVVEFGVQEYKGVVYTSFLDGSTKDSSGAYDVGDTMSEVINTDDKKFGLVNSKEMCIAVKHAFERQVNGKEGYSIEQAEKDLTNDEANSWTEDPEVNKKLIGLLFSLEAWNVQRTNSQTKKPDDFTAKKYKSAV